MGFKEIFFKISAVLVLIFGSLISLTICGSIFYFSILIPGLNLNKLILIGIVLFILAFIIFIVFFAIFEVLKNYVITQKEINLLEEKLNDRTNQTAHQPAQPK